MVDSATLEKISSELGEIDGPVSNLCEATARLFRVKVLANKLAQIKEEQSRPWLDQLKSVREKLVPIEEACAKSEKALKQTIIEAYHASQTLQKRALREAEEAHAAGDMESVQKATLQANACELKLPEGMSLRRLTTFEIEKLDQVPRQMLILDKKAAGRYLQSQGDPAIPGIRLVEKITIAVRAQEGDNEPTNNS